MVVQGKTPRVRGNQGYPHGVTGDVGSIPAGAGEPPTCVTTFILLRVYPRGCGGTNAENLFNYWAEGLSPRVRGNPTWAGGANAWRRSIPAGAGEPYVGGRSQRMAQVYPRGCVGTRQSSRLSPSGIGLSPRVRGNPPLVGFSTRATRSIPAGAGEPTPERVRDCMAWVYPRGCGGTFTTLNGPSLTNGLSPRVRGNPGLASGSVHLMRSIPAGAGEPLSRGLVRAASRVYPRGCGGTVAVPIGWWVWLGLSPRVRGNR